MMTTSAFEATLVEGGRPTRVRVMRDSSGELQLGSADSTSIVEQLLVYDLGEDPEESVELAERLRSIGTGRGEPVTCGWNVTELSIGPVTSHIRLSFEGGGDPVELRTRELHDVVVAFRDFLESTARG